jgi:hypothetical protein
VDIILHHPIHGVRTENVPFTYLNSTKILEPLYPKFSAEKRTFRSLNLFPSFAGVTLMRSAGDA